MVAAAVTVRKLDRLPAEGETEELMAQADPEDRDRAVRELADRADRVRHRCRVAWAVREEDPVRLQLARARGWRLRRDHGDPATLLGEQPQDVALHAVVVGDNVIACARRSFHVLLLDGRG